MKQPFFLQWANDPRHARAEPSLEGIFDGIGSWFKSSVKADAKGTASHRGGARDPYRDGLGWAEHGRKMISETFANQQWVEKHLHAQQQTSRELAFELSYAGAVFATPALALQHAVKKSAEFHREYQPAMARYAQELQKAQGDRELKARIKLPFPEGFKGPEFFAGIVPVVASLSDVEREVVGEKSFNRSLPQLSARDVVQGAQEVLKTVNQMQKPLAEFFRQYDMDELGAADSQVEMFMLYENLTCAVCTEVGKWLYEITK